MISGCQRTCAAFALESGGAADPVLHQQAHASAGIVAALLHQPCTQQPLNRYQAPTVLLAENWQLPSRPLQKVPIASVLG